MQNRSSILSAKYETILQARSKDATLPVGEFCKKHKIKPCTYFYWNNKLRIAPNQGSSHAKFIPLTIKKPLSEIRTQAKYEFRFTNGTTMSVSDELDKEKLSVLISTVAGLPL